jgi:hypothetical protein
VTQSERYLEELRRVLPWSRRRRILAELRGHLADGISAEMAHGADRAEAERITIARLGTVEGLAAQFAADEAAKSPLRGRRTFAAAAAVLFVAVVAAAAVVTHTRQARPEARTAARRPCVRGGVSPGAQVAVARLVLTQARIVRSGSGRIPTLVVHRLPIGAVCRR